MVTSLQWQNWGSDPADLMAGVVCDFSIVKRYEVIPRGPFSQGDVVAAGVVIDNLTNANPARLQVAGLVETVPPYSKNLITLPNTAPVVQITADNGETLLVFYRGTFHGSGASTNFYDAQRQANLSTLANGTVDALFNTVRAVHNYNLTAGLNLNTFGVNG